MISINVEIDEKLLRSLVARHLDEMCAGLGVTENDIKIEVKSKQNYRAEWEEASFRARVAKVAP